MNRIVGFLGGLLLLGSIKAQTFEGNVVDSESGNPLEGVTVHIVEDNRTTTTNASGEFSLMANDTVEKTIRFEVLDYMFEEQYNVLPSSSLSIELRLKKKSAATLREEGYINSGSCAVDNPENPDWNIAFEEVDLQGDLAPNSTYTRRDPSAVIEIDGTYYVWYSYSLTQDSEKTAPWDLNDLYYATSTDGDTWTEQGLAVGRGASGDYDHRSVFTTEIFVHEGTYYLVYQAAADQDGVYNRNFIGMASATSPDGPWTKTEDPVLRPTYTNELWFDNNAVHDPTLVFFNNKFHLYYKGECNCFGEPGCQRWCDPVCGLGKQVKWGVAISDNPTGPFVKSEYNPITNTGHELIIWKYDGGLNILQHQDGPEANTIQHSTDGINFEIMGTVNNIPEAAGLFRPNSPENTPHGGVEWGVSHVLNWGSSFPNGWMNIRKFVKKDGSISGMHIVQEKIFMNNNQSRKLSPVYLPYDATQIGVTWESSDEAVVSVNENDEFVSHAFGSATLTATAVAGDFTDAVIVEVTDKEIDMAQITVQVEDFTTTDNVDGLDYGGPLGMNPTGSGVNFVNRNDWADYTVDVPFSGYYHVNYRISTPSDGAEVQIRSGSTILNSQEVFNNGQWDSYYKLNGLNSFWLEGGTQTIRLFASGINDWQWNMDSFELIGEAEHVPVVLESLSFASESLSLEVSEQISLAPIISPSNADVNLTWSSSNVDVAMVTDGLVTALMEGETVVTVEDTNTGISETITVTVVPSSALVSLALDYTSTTLKVDSLVILNVTLNPSNAENIELEWNSSAPEVATVLNGYLTAKSPGFAVVTVTDINSNISTTMDVTVFAEVLSMPRHVVKEAILYPNPANDWIYVSTVEGRLTVIDQFGRVMPVHAMKHGEHMAMNVLNLVPGVYYVRIEQHNGILTLPFIKR